MCIARPIKTHLIPAFKGFTVGNQILNLTSTPPFDHNSCKLSLNEQCEGNLSIHTSRPFKWCSGGPIWCFFPLPTKVLNILNSHTNVIPKVGMHLVMCSQTVATLLWVKWEDETPTPKVEDLESSETPECLELDSRDQNTSNSGVLGVIGKVLKCRCLKCPLIGHLDICSPSYGQKKGWQFDSRPLKF
jgi:hypothetical protein